MREILRLEAVWRGFDRGRERVSVLEGVSLDVGLGEVAAVVGGRGQGKTTLVRVASGTLPVDRGRVLLGGRSLTGLSDGQLSRVLARDVGLASGAGDDRLDVQDYVGMSLAATCEYGRRERRLRVEDVLRELGLVGCASARWDELSDWQRVLVELAQAIVVRPRLLLVDDVVAGLPFEHKRAAMELVEGFARDVGCGVLLVASDHATAARAARVWSLAHGELELMHEDEPGVTYLHNPGQALDGG